MFYQPEYQGIPTKIENDMGKYAEILWIPAINGGRIPMVVGLNPEKKKPSLSLHKLVNYISIKYSHDIPTIPNIFPLYFNYIQEPSNGLPFTHKARD